MFSLLDIGLLLFTIFVLLKLYFYYVFNYWKSKGVPYSEPTFIFGNILDIIRTKENAGKYIANLYHQFEGPYFGIYAFSTPMLIVKDPEIIKRIYIKDFNTFANRHFLSDEKIDPILSNALFGIKTPHWKTLRTKLSPVFTSGKIKMMMSLIKECGENLEKHMKTILNEKVEMKDIAAKYTTDVITSCAFGINANSFTVPNSEFRKYGKIVFASTTTKIFQALSYFFAPTLAKIFKFHFIDPVAADFFRKVFTETMKQRELSGHVRNDLVDILIELKKEEKQDDEFKFVGDRLVAQAIIFFSAGFETTSSAIAFALHELCINTDIQDKLRNEIQETIKKHKELTYEALQDMKYLQMVILETLRKYPLTPFLHRENSEDFVFPETGLLIKKGTAVIIPQHGLHWDPKYFPNPTKFDPERFNEENKKNIPPYVFAPFGDDPRNCIGERFALISTKLGVIHVLKSYKVQRNSETIDPLVFGKTPLLQSKDGIRLTCTKLET